MNLLDFGMFYTKCFNIRSLILALAERCKTDTATSILQTAQRQRGYGILKFSR